MWDTSVTEQPGDRLGGIPGGADAQAALSPEAPAGLTTNVVCALWRLGGVDHHRGRLPTAKEHSLILPCVLPCGGPRIASPSSVLV